MVRRSLPLVAFVLLAVFLAGPAWSAILYVNGSNSTSNGYNVSAIGQAVSNSFDLSGDSTLTGVEVGLEMLPNASDQPLTVDWSIGTAYFGNEISSGTATLSNAFFGTYTNPSGNDYNVYTSDFALNVTLPAGSYWLTLQNVTTPTPVWPVFWAANGGDSTAYRDYWGSYFQIDSEYFQISGEQSPVPVPAALLLLGSGLAGLAGVKRRKA